MSILKVFIGSSNEALAAARTVKKLLKKELTNLRSKVNQGKGSNESKENVTPQIDTWRDCFPLSETTIESLEAVMYDYDFAVLIVTPDDQTYCRKEKWLSPRDNVLFELGLFMGQIGRDRSYILEARSGISKLKIPNDLLGVTSERFTPPAKEGEGDQAWLEALRDSSRNIAVHISRKGLRDKVDSDKRASREALRSFRKKIVGAWWDRIDLHDRVRIGFFWIHSDEMADSVSLDGRAFDENGEPSAKWSSVMATLNKDERKILYAWRGWHTGSDGKHFHGLGEIQFVMAADNGSTIDRGHGFFWNVDEANPKNTIVYPKELRRATDQDDIDVMESGNRGKIAELVKRRLRELEIR